jgi:hypothetical protein
MWLENTHFILKQMIMEKCKVSWQWQVILLYKAHVLITREYTKEHGK